MLLCTFSGMCLTESSKTRKEACTYEKWYAYEKGALIHTKSMVTRVPFSYVHKGCISYVCTLLTSC